MAGTINVLSVQSSGSIVLIWKDFTGRAGFKQAISLAAYIKVKKSLDRVFMEREINNLIVIIFKETYKNYCYLDFLL